MSQTTLTIIENTLLSIYLSYEFFKFWKVKPNLSKKFNIFAGASVFLLVVFGFRYHKENQKKELDKAKQQIQALQEECKIAQQKLLELLDIISQLKNDIQKNEQNYNQEQKLLENQKNAALQQLQKLSKQLGEQQKEVENLIDQINQLKGEIKKNKDNEIKNIDKQTQQDKLIDEKEKQIIKLQKEVQNKLSIIKKLDELLGKFKQIQTPYTQTFQPNEARIKEIQKIINHLYDQSWRKRHTDEQFKYFVRGEENKIELCRNYSIRQSEKKEKLHKICTSFRQARGDGNCFYTAFGYQFLLILLIEYEDQQFFSFLAQIKNIKLRMQISLKNLPNIENPQNFNNAQTEMMLLDEFLYRLLQFRDISDVDERRQTFTFQFAAYEKFDDNTDGCLYGLSTIFFRNLANLVVEESEFKQQVYDRHTLLIWEEECNNNEVVIDELAKYLNIHVKLLLFDNGDFIERDYLREGAKNKVILLIKPGHYSIGLKQKENDQIQEPESKQIKFCQGCEPKIYALAKFNIKMIDQNSSEIKQILMDEESQ